MHEDKIEIIYNEDEDQFEAWNVSGHGRTFIYMDEDPVELVEMISEDVEELKVK